MRGSVKRNLLLATVGFAGGLIGALWMMREPMEPLTEAALAAARKRWQAAGLRDYDLHYRMQGDDFDVKVRGGIVTEVLRNGRPTRTQNARLYGVDGLFDILAEDLDNLHNPSGPFARRGNVVVMRVRFHPELGYVERYLRSTGGVGRGASIEVLSLTPVR